MLRNFFINLFFLIPVWLIDLLSVFNKDVKRKFIFDKQSKLFLSLIPKFDIHKVSDDDISEIRNLIDERRKNLRLSKRTKKKVEKIDHLIGKNKKIKIREYIPYQTDNEKVILFFHGGGYVLNSIETHDPSVAYFSEKLRTKIYSLDYSLSPENKFPCALNEAISAIEWLIQCGNKISNISLCGDSAGAHLAASVTHHFANENKENVHSQFLIYPMCDPSCDYDSHKLFKEGYLLTKKAMHWFWEKFESSIENQSLNTFNLMLYEGEAIIPKTIIVTAGFDPLSDEAENYAFLLHEGGTSVKQLHYPSLFHGFASMTRLKAARKAVNDFLSEYKEIL
tara:strand:- start:1571 stop:2581 length:1011 start_codon:yes stop_codon:yes gene_type:complete